MKKGILYGVGVGPGDSELMTLKAARLARECDIIAVPHKDRNKCVALKIATGAVPELADKPLLEVEMPMTKDKDILEAAYVRGTKLLQEQLDAGKTVVFLTLGDPTVYSTYCYLHQQITALGYETQIVPGVTSFCASAAALNIPLCENKQELHVIPGTYNPDEALSLPGTKVLMKNNLPKTLAALREHPQKVWMVENCGMENQHIYCGLENLPENSGYYTVLIVKEEA